MNECAPIVWERQTTIACLADLDGGPGGVPEGPADAVIPRDVGGLEEGGRPRPLRHDDGRGEARLDHAPGGAAAFSHGEMTEVLRGHFQQIDGWAVEKRAFVR